MVPGGRLAILLGLLLARPMAILAGGIQIVVRRMMSASSCMAVKERFALILGHLARCRAILASRLQIVARRTISARSCWVLGIRLAILLRLLLILVWLLVIGATPRALAVQSRSAVDGTHARDCSAAMALLARGETL
jgi:hypothetical protein